jgi:hypothetical protein
MARALLLLEEEEEEWPVHWVLLFLRECSILWH